MDLKTCISAIINDNFYGGEEFDSHTVINLMFTTEEYLLSYLQGYEYEESIKCYHSKIANIIKTIPNVKDMKKEVKTLTIFKKLSKNHLWRKE